MIMSSISSDKRFDAGYFTNTKYRDRPLFFYHFVLLANSTLKKNSKILEIGCAEGYLLKRIEEKFETYGVDVSEYAVKIARENAVKSRIFVQDANNISFQSEKFDMVIALSILEHLREPEKCIQRCYQILRKNGVAVFQVPNTGSISVGLKGKEWHGYRDKTHLSLKSPDEWVKLLKSAGFKIIKTYGDGLTDVPYLKNIPMLMQRMLISIPSTILFSLGVRFPLKIGEGLILISKK